MAIIVKSPSWDHYPRVATIQEPVKWQLLSKALLGSTIEGRPLSKSQLNGNYCQSYMCVRACMSMHACMPLHACTPFFVFLQDSEQVVERVRLACHFPIGDHNDLSTLNSLALGFKQMYRKVITPQSFDNPRLSITAFTTKGFPNS